MLWRWEYGGGNDNNDGGFGGRAGGCACACRVTRRCGLGSSVTVVLYTWAGAYTHKPWEEVASIGLPKRRGRLDQRLSIVLECPAEPTRAQPEPTRERSSKERPRWMWGKGHSRHLLDLCLGT